MATFISPVSVSGGNHLKTCGALSVKSGAIVKTQLLKIQSKPSSRTYRNLSVRAEYKDGIIGQYIYCCIWIGGFGNEVLYWNSGGATVKKDWYCREKYEFLWKCPLLDHNGGNGADFVAGFLVGGAVFGTLAYIFAPQIRRSLLNEDEYGFRRAKRPIYYDDGLEKTRQTLNEKISQLNSAIDNVSSRLRGGNNLPEVPIETDAEEEAAL